MYISMALTVFYLSALFSYSLEKVDDPLNDMNDHAELDPSASAPVSSAFDMRAMVKKLTENHHIILRPSEFNGTRLIETRPAMQSNVTKSVICILASNI
ncbi:hypothetical protein F5B20DRAFT_542297 [Whalleya microplaca]|nr:hypothetical protein F5B20DRAFT_542297 [Whalleya microplaca]